MIIGVPKEIKVHEYRVGMTPASVAEAVVHGHGVLVEAGAGAGIGPPDNAGPSPANRRPEFVLEV